MAVVKIAAFSVDLKPSKHYQISNLRGNQEHRLKILKLASEIKVINIFRTGKVLRKLPLKIYQVLQTDRTYRYNESIL